ncbi:NB-ARC domain-containing protein [Candidatus Venteria ishoeyi]|uniref:Regulatory protein AfsR n=1 Tax=Candidatus Venteria ishoeyi TaxID=1899563 RepID=A0A1H6F5F5_9GAMM|nr:NB-ARC domain-containing protein [Candidatus Venteria ishoeyi]SEH04793.1 Regulatory protein AfsR [Candidatus Venteria ishoeyi]
MSTYNQESQKLNNQTNIAENINKQSTTGKGNAQADRGGTATVNIYNHYTKPDGTHVPLHRPPKVVHFTDRVETLKQLLKDLQPGKTVTLCGSGGIGKTALAAEAIWQIAPENKPPQDFPDGIVFHSFYHSPSADIALESIAQAFGEEAIPTPMAGAQRALSGRCALLVLDGAEDADDLRKVQSVAGNCGMLVTTRNRRDAIAKRQDMSPLELDDAVKLLHEWADQQIDNEQVAKQICCMLGGLPLAVRLVGRYLNETGDTTTEYLTWLENKPLEALNPDQSNHRHESVSWLMERSLEQVGQDARDVLALAGQLAIPPFSTEIISQSLGLDDGTLRRAIRELTGYGLLQRNGKRYEVTHTLIHTYARELLELPAEVFERLLVGT